MPIGEGAWNLWSGLSQGVNWRCVTDASEGAWAVEFSLPAGPGHRGLYSAVKNLDFTSDNGLDSAWAVGGPGDRL